MMLRQYYALALIASTALFVACSDDASEEPQYEMQWTDDGLPQSDTTVMTPGGKADSIGYPTTFEQFLEYVYCESDGRICVVDGDTPIAGGMTGLHQFYERHVAPSEGQSLSVNVGNRGDDLWYGDERHDLSFCISDDFGEDKEWVVEATVGAAEDWEAIADVTFPYRDDQDHRCDLDNQQVLFPVLPGDDDAPYLARAFFPDFDDEDRDVRINVEEILDAKDSPRMEELSFRGIMRHELGHVLGFRHEHTREEAGNYWCFEDNDYRPGTAYDVRSVMHYPQCDGENDWRLEFSEFDEMGAQYFYPPEGVETLGRCDDELDDEGYVDEGCEPVVRQITDWLSQYGEEQVLEDWMGLSEDLSEAVQSARLDRPFDDFDDLRDRADFDDDDIRDVYDYLFDWGRCPDAELDDDEWVKPNCFPVVNAILELANNASFVVLDEDVGVDVRGVENIVAARDQRPIDTYDALISLGYVKQAALYAMYDYLYDGE